MTKQTLQNEKARLLAEEAATERDKLKNESESDSEASARKKPRHSNPTPKITGFVDRVLTAEDQKKADELLCEAFVSGNIPWSFADNPELKKYIKFIRPCVAVPCRQTLSGKTNTND